jgi:hypothetical protein
MHVCLNADSSDMGRKAPKKKISLVTNSRLLRIKAKTYGTITMYTFVIEEIMDYGVTQIAKFGRFVTEIMFAVLLGA